MSETTLHRLARLQDPSAALDRDSFEDALRAAGWREARIERAVAEVTRRSLLARVVWSRETAVNASLCVGIGILSGLQFGLSHGVLSAVVFFVVSTILGSWGDR